MSYFIQFERELTRRIDSRAEDTASIVSWASDRILESYYRGVKMEQKNPHRVNEE